MYLYLSENPRILYLVTSGHDERQGRPSKALVFRTVEGSTSQAIVEFRSRDEVDLTDAVKLSNRVIKGCLGLISVSQGMLFACSYWGLKQSWLRIRHIPCRHYISYRSRKYSSFCPNSGVRCTNP